MPRWSPLERELRAARGPLLAGVDEVGRGPLAGPVVACAVVMSPDARAIRGVDDSKKLDRADRERLAARVLVTEHRLYPAALAMLAQDPGKIGEAAYAVTKGSVVR